MTRIHTLLAALGAALMLAAAAHAQDVSWEYPGRLDAGQPAALALVFADTEPAGRITPPEVDGLTHLGAPSRQSSISIVNGARSTSLTLSFPVRAEREGTITIPSFEVDTAAGAQTVPALTLEVGAATPSGNGRHSGAAQPSDVVEARLTPSHMTPYAGEVFDVDVTVGLTAGRRGQVVGTPAWGDPGVTAEPWSEGRTVSIHNGSGVHFHTRAVASQPGRIEVAPVRQDVEIEIGHAGVDPFEGFSDDLARRFGGADLFGSLFSRPQTTAASVRSNSVQLDVQALPQPAPEGFSGAVGQFTLESNLVPAQPKTGEPVTWTLALKGTGNWPGAVALPARAVPNDFRTLQPKQHREFAPGELFSGTLREDLVMVPHQPGDYTLAPVRFVYFDPAKGQYQTIEARPPVLHIAGAPIAAAPQSQPAVASAPASNAPVAAPSSAAPADREAASRPLPHDPLSGGAGGWAPIAGSRLSQLAAVPFILLAVCWIALAVRRARLTDPRRPQRQALARLAAAIERVRGAATAEERIAALLAWQHTAATALGLDVAVPKAGQLDDQRWVDVWAGSERALYGREHVLPGGWCDRALSVCTRTRRPRFNPLRAFTMRNLVPKAASAALLLSMALAAAPARAADTPDPYTHGDFAAAREQWLARAKQAPSDWIARYNLGLAAIQLGDAPRALAQTVAAFVHAPRNDDVRWNARAFAASVPGLDRSTAALLSGSAVASFASPAAWQALLIAGAWILCGGAALLLQRRYGAQRAPSRVGAAALAVGITLAGMSALALRAYGPLADPQAALTAGQPVLRSVPTEAEGAPQQKPLAAGTLVVVERDFLGWVKVGLRSGETGWLRHGDIVPLFAAPSA